MIKEIYTKLEKYKSIFELPRLFLINHFSELKKEVDFSFTKTILKTADTLIKEKLTKNWLEIISYIETFEKECLTRQKTNKFNDEIETKCSETIDLLETELIIIIELKNDNEKNKYFTIDIKNKILPFKNNKFKFFESLINDFTNIIEEALLEINKVLFLNKTVEFIPKDYMDSCKISFFSEMDPQIAVGKLIIIKNDFFKKEDIFQTDFNKS